MKQPELVLDLSVDGLSLWQPVEAADWILLGFANLEDPDLAAKIIDMRHAGVQTAGPEFGTMLLLPDDHIWVQRLHLHGLTARAKDENARKVLANATSLPQSGFSVAFGDTDADGTAVAATTTEVLEEARKFARDNGFNPLSIASRSFPQGFATRAIFGDAPKPLAFLPRKPVPAPSAKTTRAPNVAEFILPKFTLPKLTLPKIPRNWALGGIATVVVGAAVIYWAIDPYEQFLRPPKALAELTTFDSPDHTTPPPSTPRRLDATPFGQSVASLAKTDLPMMVALADTFSHASDGQTQIGVAFDAAGVYFAEVPTPPKTPSGIGAKLSWNAPSTMFLESPTDEPAIGVAAVQKLPEMALSREAPQDSGFLENVLLSAVSTRSVGPLSINTADLGLPATDVVSDFAYRNATVALSGAVVAHITAAIVESEPTGLNDPQVIPSLQLAALSGPVAPNTAPDVLIATPEPAISAPGTRPLARPDAFSIIHPSEAIAALTPAAVVPPTELPVFGPEWPRVVGEIPPAGVIEFDSANPTHFRPLARPDALVVKAADAAAQVSIIALNLPADAALDVGLGWQEYNPDNPAHVRPQWRPSSLQQLAEQGDLAPTTLAIKTSIRPSARPSSIDAIILARGAELASAQAAAAQAEARAQSVAEAAAIALAESAPVAESAALASDADADLAALDDAEPESSLEVASLPTSANVAETATIENGLDRGQISLIGIYGSEGKRRALVRLPSGRYERVTVGDSFSGWKVAAIGADAIRVVKGGKEAILRMPN